MQKGAHVAVVIGVFPLKEVKHAGMRCAKLSEEREEGCKIDGERDDEVGRREKSPGGPDESPVRFKAFTNVGEVLNEEAMIDSMRVWWECEGRRFMKCAVEQLFNLIEVMSEVFSGQEAPDLHIDNTFQCGEHEFIRNDGEVKEMGDDLAGSWDGRRMEPVVRYAMMSVIAA